MKKGFTLVELIGVLVLLAALSLIIIPIVDKQIKDVNQKLYDKQIDSIKIALELWASDNGKPRSWRDEITITLSQLKQAGLVDFDLKNPLTKELFPNDMLLTITMPYEIIEYDVLVNTGSNKDNFMDIPTIEINGDVIDRVKVDKSGQKEYIEKGAVAKVGNNVLEQVTIETEPNLDISKKGTYIRKYSATFNGKTNTVIKTIIVSDY